MWIISVYGANIPLHLAQPIISAVSCILGVKIISKRLTYNLREDILLLVVAGIIGSILNGLFNSFLMNDTFLSTQVRYRQELQMRMCAEQRPSPGGAGR